MSDGRVDQRTEHHVNKEFEHMFSPKHADRLLGMRALQLPFTAPCFAAGGLFLLGEFFPNANRNDGDDQDLDHSLPLFCSSL